MSKMFVHYSKSVAEFKNAANNGVSLEQFYDKHIVFIGNGEAVFTHGKYYGDVKEALAALEGRVDGLDDRIDALNYFSKIKVGETTATAPSADSTITFSAENPSEVTVTVDPQGIKIGLAEDFVKAVNEDLPADIAAAKKAGEDAAAAVDAKLGEKGAAAASGSEATAFGRIKNLETIVAGLTGSEGGEVESVDAKITKAIEALDVNAAEEGDFVASISQVDGKIEATMGTFNFDEKGAAAAAQSAAEATAAADAASKVNAAKEEIKGTTDALAGRIKAVEDDYLTSADKTEITGAASALEGRVKANEDAIGVLNGAGDGSVKKQVADAIAGVVASAPEDFDTLKEVADWIASDTTGAAKMQADIATLKGDDTTEGSVAKTVKDAVAAEAAIARAAEQANAGAIDAIEADYLKASDKTELSNKITALEEAHTADEETTAQALTDLNNKYNELSETVEANVTAAQTYTNEAIAALDVTDEAVANQFVTAVSETDGKIAVSRSAINASQIGITNTEDDAFDAATTNVQDALTELASFWAWEEL